MKLIFIGWEIYNTGQGDASCYLRPSVSNKLKWADAQKFCQNAYLNPDTGSKNDIKIL